MEVTITEERITVVAHGEWCEEQWNDTLTAHGVIDELVDFIDYEQDEDIQVWTFGRLSEEERQ